jgi:DNA-binding NtrC family response regulator
MPNALRVVLLVDDEPALLRMMSVYLTRIGYEVASFGQTEPAWEYARENAARLYAAVLDLSMGGMTALDLGSSLLAANPKLKLIVASGYPTDLRDFEEIGPGRVTFLHKPFSPEMLAATMEEKTG